MLDIEFLAAPVSFTGVLLYRYRTGILRRELRERVASTFQSSGRMLASCKPDELVVSWVTTDLFDSIRFCDLSETSRSPKAARDVLLNLLERDPAAPTILFINANAFDAQQGRLDGVVSIEEPLISSKNVLQVVRFLEEMSGCVSRRSLTTQMNFESYIQGWLVVNGPATLLELGHELDRATLLFVDHATGLFNPPVDEENIEVGPSYVVRTLRKILEAGGTFELAPLLQALARKRRRGWSDIELFEDLFRATRLICQGTATEKFGRLQYPGYRMMVRWLWLWSVLLLVWAERFRADRKGDEESSSKDLLVVIDQLLRQFRERCAFGLVDPLMGYWSEYSKAIRVLGNIDENHEDNRCCLLDALSQLNATAEQPDWLHKAFRLAKASTECSESGSVDQRPIIVETPEVTLLGFSDIVGQDKAVDLIKKRFEENDHRQPLALVGPSGSGKTSIARLYAKALLCAGVRGRDWSPCGDCSGCKSFDKAGSFGFIEIDLTHSSALEHAREHVAHLRKFPFSSHRIIVLKAPHAATEALEVFLKPFEDYALHPGEDRALDTTFLILVSDKSSLLAAARSRSDIVQMQKLDLDQSRQLICKWLPQDIDVRIPELVCLLNDGRPGEMAKSAQILAAGSVRTLKGAQSALGVDWGEEILSYWEDLLSEESRGSAESDVLCTFESTVVLYRVRQVL